MERSFTWTWQQQQQSDDRLAAITPFYWSRHRCDSSAPAGRRNLQIIGENRLIVRSKTRSVHPRHCLEQFAIALSATRWRQGRFRPADESFRRTAKRGRIFPSGRTFSLTAFGEEKTGTMTTLKKDEKRGSKKSKKSGEKTSGRSAKTAKQVPAKKSEPKVQAGIASSSKPFKTKRKNDLQKTFRLCHSFNISSSRYSCFFLCTFNGMML